MQELRSVSFLPHYSTLRKAYKPHLLRCLAPRGLGVFETVDNLKSGVNSTSLVHNGESLSQGRCVLPREPSHVNESGSPSFSYCVDKIPVVSARDWFYGPRKAMHIETPIDGEKHTSFAKFGDILSVKLLRPAKCTKLVQSCFGCQE